MVNVDLSPAVAAAASSTDVLVRLRPHLVNLTDGLFSSTGAATTSAADVDAIMDVHLPAFVAAHGPGAPVLLWAHGGLVDEAAGIAAAARKVDWLLANGIYPIFFVWESGIGDALRQQLLGRLGAGDLAGFLADAADAAIVAALRVGGVGARVWSSMKRSAERASAPGGGAAYVAAALGRFVAAHPGAVTLHAAGHSAGAVFHSEFVPAAIAQGLSFPTVSLLAPAVRVDTFTRTLAPTVGAGVDALTVYTMRRELELRDTCALGPLTLYHHSLLYLIRAALEDALHTPILGLEESLRGDPATAALFNGPAATVVWSTTAPGAPVEARSLSTSHGGFDDDPATMASIARRVTGRVSVTPFLATAGELAMAHGAFDGPRSGPAVTLSAPVAALLRAAADLVDAAAPEAIPSIDAAEEPTVPKIKKVGLGPDHGLGHVRSMPDYRAQLAAAAPLSVADRTLLVDQAELLLDGLYAHLPLKRAMHADDPVQRLRLLRRRVADMSEGDFHAELLTIFIELRDLHTNYILPTSYAGFAFLGILVEECDDGGPRWLVTKVYEHLVGDANLVVGAEITHWNGMPMALAVDRNADRESGSNSAARRARGVEGMTLRPVRLALAPDEDWVQLTYLVGTTVHETRLPWQVVDAMPDVTTPSTAAVRTSALSAAVVAPPQHLLGLDLRTDLVQHAKRDLFAPEALTDVARAAARAARPTRAQAQAGVVPTTRPELKARIVDTSAGPVAHLRIYTFYMRDGQILAFLDEVERLLTNLPQDGLVLDVRGNGGGYVFAAEALLQLLTPMTITPEPMQFAATVDTDLLCRAVADFGAWEASLDEAVSTGAQFSSALPLYPADAVNSVGQVYQGPVVLVTDALCYSATDIFSAGFQDHGIGTVLGVAGNTGAGGANVLEHTDLLNAWPGGPLTALPAGARMRVALRRCLRVGDRAGQPVEDLGVVPDDVHHLTRQDLLVGNVDLMEAAAKLLLGQTRRGLMLERADSANGRTRLTITSRGLTSVDVYVGARPVTSSPVTDAAPTVIEIATPGPGVVVRVDGFDGGDRAVASRRA